MIRDASPSTSLLSARSPARLLLASVLAVSLLGSPTASVFAEENPWREAGQATKEAGKAIGHATAETAATAWEKTKQASRRAARVAKREARRAARATKRAARKAKEGTERAVDKTREALTPPPAER
jgi:hypothetical protein